MSISVFPVLFKGKQTPPPPPECKSKVKNKGVIKGLAAQTASSVVLSPLNVVPLALMYGYNNKLPADKVKILEDVADKAVQAKDLKDIVKLERLEVEKNPGIKKIIQSFASPFGVRDQIRYGLNAGFDNFTNTILMPKGKLALASFHEMGHVKNFNYSKIGKILQQSRMPLMGLASCAALIGIFKKDKVNATNEDGTKKKGFTQFIKNHAGKISAALLAPTVIEEAMASHKGNNIAKEVLKDAPELIKKVKVNNAIALLTYVSMAAILGISTAFAIKVKDNAQAKYEEKLNA